MIRLTFQAQTTDGQGAAPFTQTFDLAPGQKIVFGREAGSTDIQIAGKSVSRVHFEIVATEDGAAVTDLGSTNGTKLDGARIAAQQPVALRPGQTVAAGEWRLTVEFQQIDASQAQAGAGSGPASRILEAAPAASDAPGRDDIPAAPVLNPGDVLNTARLVNEIAYCAIGGGLGSFVWVDHLRCYGVHTDDIMAIGLDPVCYGTYARYCKNSQIPDHERLRSNSASTPDNIWGFPGYALRETVTTGNPLYVFQVFGEPTLAQSYTPRAGRVFRSLDREQRRIQWDRMFAKGTVQALRLLSDGRYAIYWRTTRDIATGSDRNRLTIARIVHLSTGYPATRFVDDFQDFISNHPGHAHFVANAYDPHEYIYQDIEQSGRPMNVVVRGRGIVASRILQRLSEARARNPGLRILHSIRSPIRSRQGAKYGWASRPVRDNVELQPFNWPKAAWGGDVRQQYERADAAERGRILATLGGTTTAERSDWIAIAERGGEEGWYRAVFGGVAGIEPAENGTVITVNGPDGSQERLAADYLIDCTGLVADLKRSEFLRDLIETYGLPQNHAWRQRGGQWEQGAKTGLQVSPAFEIEGLRNGPGRVYAAGNITSGGPYLAVDSFLGLQYSALRSVDDIGDNRLTRMRPPGAVRNFGQWLRWCAGAAP